MFYQGWARLSLCGSSTGGSGTLWKDSSGVWGAGDGGWRNGPSPPSFFFLTISFSVLYMQSVQKLVNIAESRVVSKSDNSRVHIIPLSTSCINNGFYDCYRGVVIDQDCRWLSSEEKMILHGHPIPLQYSMLQGCHMAFLYQSIYVVLFCVQVTAFRY